MKTQVEKNIGTLNLTELQTRIVQSTLNNFNNEINKIRGNTIKLKKRLDQLV